VLLAAANNPNLQRRAMAAPFVRRSVARFMPGEHLEDALSATADLRTLGIGTMLTKLGENIASRGEAEAVTAHYLDGIDRIDQGGWDAQISVKPTQLGLDLDPSLCAQNLHRLVERATAMRQFVWIDMEQSAYVDRTLELFRAARERSPLVGLALQAYLRRTPADVEALLPISPSIRLVKGAYLEPPAIAYPKKRDVDRAYYALASRLLSDEARRTGVRVQIATHDLRMIGQVGALIAMRKVPADAYEYAMLYGIQRQLQEQLARAGHRLRVLISYGEHWFPWYTRRLAERPANVWFVVRNLFAG
jgi:proline dehydrogenase